MLPTDTVKYVSFLHLPGRPEVTAYIFVSNSPQRYDRNALCQNYTVSQCKTKVQSEKAFGYLMASVYTCKKPDIVINNFPVPEQFLNSVLTACELNTPPVHVPNFSDVHDCKVYPLTTLPTKISKVFVKLLDFLNKREDDFYLTNSRLADILYQDHNLSMTVERARQDFRVFLSDDIYLKGSGLVTVSALLTSLGRTDLVERCEK